MDRDDTFHDAWVGLRNGSDDAARLVWQMMWRRMVTRFRPMVSTSLRAACDEEDVVQSGFRTAFRRASSGRFDHYELKGWDDLERLLTRITERKYYNKLDASLTARRGNGKLEGIEPGELADRAVSREPACESSLRVQETWESVVRSFKPTWAAAANMLREGYSCDEIAARLPMASRSVSRLKQTILKRLEAELRTEHE